MILLAQKNLILIKMIYDLNSQIELLSNQEECMRIGIIEDDTLLRKALDTSLKNQGYTTILAGSRKEAIKNIDSSVDLLIVDIGLPGWRWNKLYQELQKNRKIPAIFLTAKDDEKDMLKAFDIGADDYVD